MKPDETLIQSMHALPEAFIPEEIDDASLPSMDSSVPCPVCGTSDIESRLELESFEYGVGKSTVMLRALVPCRQCRACGFEFVDDAADRARHAAVCRHFRVLTPEEIRAIRASYSLNRKQFASITGFGEATIARWESGALIQNTASDRYLRALRDQYVFDLVQRVSHSDDESTAGPTRTGRQFRCLSSVEIERMRDQARGFCPSSRSRVRVG